MRLSRLSRVSAACCLLGAGALVGASPTSAAPAASCVLQPALRDVTINQGLGSYTPLVRGKDTLVRLYLSLPSCAGSTSSIQVTAATLAVSNGGTVTSPSPSLVSTYPSVVSYATGAALDSPGNPVFQVPGSMLAPSSSASAYTATFSAAVSWTAKAGQTTTTGTTTYRTKPDGSAFAAAVDKRTNALRLLLVPMGDARQTYATQFTTAAQQTTVNALSTLARTFPVPSGLGPLSGTTGGVRYAIDPTLLDIGDLIDTSTLAGRFCGTGSTQYSTISSRLAQFLQSWNSANASATADRVVGVVDGAISGGGNDGCALGWSQLNTNQSWFRADPAATPQLSGSVLTMEVAHSLGLVPASRQASTNPGHSANIVADGTSPGRAYDVSAARYDNDNHTAMRVYGSWADANTLLEQLDFGDLRCRLGGSVTSTCTTTGTVGTTTGVGNGSTLRITGNTNGTETGTTLTESGFIQNGDITAAPASSEYTLVQRQGSQVLRTDLLPVSFAQELTSTTDLEATVRVGTFAVSVPFQGDKANRVDIVRTVAGSSPHVLLTLNRGTLGRPVVDAPTITPGAGVDISNAFGDESYPAVSPGGQYVAWSAPSGVGSTSQITVVQRSDSATTTIDDAAQPAWSADGTRLAFVRSGDGSDSLWTVDIRNDDGFSTTSERFVYSGSPSHPTWSPDGDRIAFAESRDLFTVPSVYNPDVAGAGASTRLTSLGNASWPSWSRTPGNNAIAFQVGDFSEVAGSGPAVSLLDPVRGGITPLVSNATQPAFADDGNVLVNRNGSLLAYPAVGGTPVSAAAGVGSAPARAGGVTAYAQFVDRFDAPSDDDVFLSTGQTISGTVRVDTVTNPFALRAELRLTCPGGPTYPVAVGLPLEIVSAEQARYSYVLDTAPVCSGARLSVLATDGFSFSLPRTGDLVTGASHAPIAAIHRPTDGGTFLQYDAIVLSGAGFDLDTGAIPESGLRWTFDGGPAGTGRVVSLSPSPNGWGNAFHDVHLAATDPAGNVGSADGGVATVGDGDHDGIPDSLEPTVDVDPSGDCDGDVIPNIDEVARGTALCTSPTTEYAASEDFDPDSLNVPSSGNAVTDYVRLPYRSIADVDPASVALTGIAGDAVGPVHAVRIPVTSWSISGSTATAKLDRALVTRAIVDTFPGQRISGRVLLYVSGRSRSGAWTFTGYDTTYVLPSS